jgi:hypothetical protein
MSIAVIGGMDRLGPYYRKEAAKLGITLKIFNSSEPGIASKVKAADAVVIFTGKVSHRARNEVMHIARSFGIPVHQFHSCGLCTLRNCFTCIRERGRVYE